MKKRLVCVYESRTNTHALTYAHTSISVRRILILSSTLGTSFISASFAVNVYKIVPLMFHANSITLLGLFLQCRSQRLNLGQHFSFAVRVCARAHAYVCIICTSRTIACVGVFVFYYHYCFLILQPHRKKTKQTNKQTNK